MRLAHAIPLVGLLIAAPAARPAESTWSTEAWLRILARYASGDYAAATKAIRAIEHSAFEIRLTPDTPENAQTTWERASSEWSRVGASPEAVRRRQMVAATVALEVIRAHSDLPPNQRLSLVTWACRMVRARSDRSDAERLWYLASVVVMQQSAPLGLLPAKSNDPDLRLATTREDRAELIAGHLTHATAAFPDEKRFQLVDALTRAAATSVTSFYPSQSSMHANELPVRQPPADREQARRLAARLAVLPAIENDLRALAADEPVRAEAELNLGYLSVRQQRWDDALVHLNRVTPFTTDPQIICISHYLRGWVYGRTDRRDAAIGEYRTALELSPKARSISVMLADQLAQAGRQAEAYDVLDAALKAQTARAGAARPAGRVAFFTIPEPASDPWEQFQHGEAWLVAKYLTQLREALR